MPLLEKYVTAINKIALGITLNIFVSHYLQSAT